MRSPRQRLASAAVAILLAGSVVAQSVAPDPPAAGLAPIAPLESATDATALRDAFVELLSPRESYRAGEEFVLTARFGLEQRFLREDAIQPFQRRLDVPVQLVIAWPDDLSGAVRLGRSSIATAGGSSFALDDTIGAARASGVHEVDGRSYTVFEYEITCAATVPGEVVVPGPILRYAYATRFAEDFVHGRSALDRHDAFVRGPALTLRIEALPESGRPREFGGAVGRFSITAEASPRALAAGESLALVLTIRGEGDLGAFDPPRLSELAGFVLRGTVDAQTSEGRSITYDLAPAGAHVREIPPIAFAYFDPDPPGGYRVVRTEPIPLQVGPSARADVGTQGAVRDSSDPESRRMLIALGVALAVLLLGAGIIVWVRRRRVDERAPRAEFAARRGRARSAFEAAIEGADASDALVAFLATHLGCPPTAVIGSDLGARLVAARVPDELATRAAAWLDVLVGARYGGSLPADARARTRALADELEVAFDAAASAHRARS